MINISNNIIIHNVFDVLIKSYYVYFINILFFKVIIRCINTDWETGTQSIGKNDYNFIASVDKKYPYKNQEYRTCKVRLPIMPNMCFLTYKKY